MWENCLGKAEGRFLMGALCCSLAAFTGWCRMRGASGQSKSRRGGGWTVLSERETEPNRSSHSLNFSVRKGSLINLLYPFILPIVES